MRRVSFWRFLQSLTTFWFCCSVTKLCSTLCSPMDCSMLGPSVPNIPGSYAGLFFIAFDFTLSTTRHIHDWASFPLWPSCFILCSSPVVYWIPYHLVEVGWKDILSSSVISFCFFIQLMGFSWQEQWSALLFPLPVDHILSELFTLTFPSWVALLCVAHGFIHKPLHHDKAVIHDEILIRSGSQTSFDLIPCVVKHF